jgi:hypothetical protein
MSDASRGPTEEFLQHLQRLFEKVETDSYERHEAGAEKYGPLKFLGADTLQELYEEILDLINYGRYTAVKVLMLQHALADEAAPLVDSDTTGAPGFIPTSELMGKGFKSE